MTASATNTLCPAGQYGSTTALSVSTCSGACLAGYFCPAGSTSNQANICPQVSAAVCVLTTSLRSPAWCVARARTAWLRRALLPRAPPVRAAAAQELSRLSLAVSVAHRHVRRDHRPDHGCLLGPVPGRLLGRSRPDHQPVQRPVHGRCVSTLFVWSARSTHAWSLFLAGYFCLAGSTSAIQNVCGAGVHSLLLPAALCHVAALRRQVLPCWIAGPHQLPCR